jgi:hypothetical protein
MYEMKSETFLISSGQSMITFLLFGSSRRTRDGDLCDELVLDIYYCIRYICENKVKRENGRISIFLGVGHFVFCEVEHLNERGRDTYTSCDDFNYILATKCSVIGLDHMRTDSYDPYQGWSMDLLCVQPSISISF